MRAREEVVAVLRRKHDGCPSRPLPLPPPDSSLVDVSVLMVNYNTSHLLCDAIQALRRSDKGIALQTVIVDNASRDGSQGLLRERLGECTVIENDMNVGFGRANNQALGLARGRYVLLLNTDAFVEPETLSKTLAYMDAHIECGVLGVRLVDREGGLQPGCRYFPTPWNSFLARTGLGRFFPRVRMVDDMTWNHASVRECDWVPGCYYLIRREVIEQVGLFDPRYFLYYEEVDHCRAVKAAGWKVIYFPDTTVMHIGGESAKTRGQLTTSGRQLSDLQMESELLYFRKHHGLAGLAQAVVLGHLAALILAAKRVLMQQDVRGAWAHVRELGLLSRLVLATRLATRPTR